MAGSTDMNPGDVGKFQAKRSGSCRDCTRDIEQGGDMFFIKGEKGYFCSETCVKNHAGQYGVAINTGNLKKAAERSEAAAKYGPPKEPANLKLRCAACPNMVAPNDLVRIYCPNGDMISVCPDCAWLIDAQKRLKQLGLWFKPNAPGVPA